MAVKDRTSTTDAMFEPLKHTIELLKSYDQEMSEDTHALLQVGFSLLLLHVDRGANYITDKVRNNHFCFNTDDVAFTKFNSLEFHVTLCTSKISFLDTRFLL